MEIDVWGSELMDEWTDGTLIKASGSMDEWTDGTLINGKWINGRMNWWYID